MSNEKCTQSCNVRETQVYKLLYTLAKKLVDSEQDPDLISIFSIARAHGYKQSSKLWSEEVKAALDFINSVEEKAEKDKKAAQAEAERSVAAEDNEDPAVPFEK